MATYGGRAFSVAGPKLWNSLPRELMDTQAFEPFKKKLKTYLFSLAFMAQLFTVQRFYESSKALYKIYYVCIYV